MLSLTKVGTRSLLPLYEISLSMTSQCSLLQLQAPDASPAIQIAALRTLSYALKTLGEVSSHLLVFCSCQTAIAVAYVQEFYVIAAVWCDIRVLGPSVKSGVGFQVPKEVLCSIEGRFSYQQLMKKYRVKDKLHNNHQPEKIKIIQVAVFLQSNSCFANNYQSLNKNYISLLKCSF